MGDFMMAPYASKVPAEVTAVAREAEAAIAAGKRHPFTGPIQKQDGVPWLQAGETPSDDELLEMDFFVRGIDTDPPKRTPP